ncbi:MAG: hypothetical protein NT148_01395 [Candidatus Nealsonbacteria bacterium]|nr:hypothetical protein [Candidatus Nealsonbacteria bacterium]
MAEKFPLNQSETPQNSEKEEIVLNNEEVEETPATKEQIKEEINPENIDKLKNKLEKQVAREFAEEREVKAEKELGQIVKEEDTKERDERIRMFLSENRSESVKLDLEYRTRSKNIAEKIIHSISGRDNFWILSSYIFHNSYKSLDGLNSDISKDREKVPELKGVKGISEVALEDNTIGYLVRINIKDWPSLIYMGMAISGRGVAFIPDGLSKDSERAITDHEVYHLNNHKDKPKSRIDKALRELDTIWNTNIKKNLIGYIKFQIGHIINSPNMVKNVIKNMIRSFKDK